MLNRVRYSIVINRRLQEVLADLPRHEGLLRPQQGGYSFEAVGSMTRITFTSPGPIQSLFSLTEPPISSLDEQVAILSRLKSLLERAVAA